MSYSFGFFTRLIQRLLRSSDNKIHPAGARSIAEALRENGTLQDLKLWSNELGDEGANILAEALELNSTLRKLDIGRNGIESTGLMALAAGLSKNTGIREINIEDNRIEENDFTQFSLNLTNVNLCELKARSMRSFSPFQSSLQVFFKFPF